MREISFLIFVLASGLASWPAIVSAPQPNAPKEHWPSVVSLIMDNIDFLNRYKEPIHCFDKTNMSTYYCAKLDRRYVWITFRNADIFNFIDYLECT